MKLLLPPRPPVVEDFHNRMKAQIQKMFSDRVPIEELGYVDLEAIYDIAHDLPLIAVFSDGTRKRFGHDRDSVEMMLDMLKHMSIIQVLYEQPALDKVRFVLREACVHTNGTQCDTYGSYMGLMDNRARVFTRGEEQAIKWATIYQLPSNYTVTVVRAKSLNISDMNQRIEEMRKRRLQNSRRLLRGIFGEIRGAQIAFFANSYINEAFDRIKNIANSNVTVITR